MKHRKTSGLKIRMSQVGPWGLNAYALVCSKTRKSVLIDPGAEPDALERLLVKSEPMAIILTHSHSDHVGSLVEMRRRLKVPLMAHPGLHAGDSLLDAEQWLVHGEMINVGNHQIKVCHTPGHTADQISLVIESQHDAIVGDTIFAGGPGKTWSAKEFQTTLKTLRTIVLSWSDETICYPGHGPSFRLGDKRQYINAFLKKDHGAFFGDATWDM
ncbi:MAG: MBL fold metallo-hydrolase [Desulfobacterales bacterium]|nr:MAG: MBL fold metallo-hydrolase [Desulfobacterales bacterium]UCD88932.1 MAG: MBL fold metallo-hydrolase [Desulfobacterales bacterium]